jgi:hypothetical protein
MSKVFSTHVAPTCRRGPHVGGDNTAGEPR